VILTTEEEGVASAAAPGSRQESRADDPEQRAGNRINAFTLIRNCRFPFVLLVSMRGEYGEGMPWQIPMGRASPGCLELLGFTVHRAERADEVAPMVEAGLKMAWRSDQAVAILLTQRLIGVKDI
jgi:sulfopyruvate decarboxylase TPP-binding subunit